MVCKDSGLISLVSTPGEILRQYEGLRKACVQCIDNTTSIRDNSIHLTCELVFYDINLASSRPIASEVNLDPAYAKYIVHQSLITSSLHDIVLKHLTKLSESSSSKGKSTVTDSEEKLPSWIQWYIHAFSSDSQTTSPDDMDSDQPHTSAFSFRALLPEYPARPLRRPMPNLGAFAPSSSSIKQNTLKAYHHLSDLSQPLHTLLRGKAFLEFPTFVFIPESNEDANEHVVLVEDVPEDGVVLLRDRKRRHVDVDGTTLGSKPKRMATNLVAYGSDEDDNNEEKMATGEDTALGVLGGYDSESSDDPAPEEDQDAEEDGEDDDGAVNEAEAKSKPLPPTFDAPLASRWLTGEVEAGEEEVDWGEEDAE